MATKVAKLGAFGGMHTAGIFSDMTVDGPEIGTLVVVIDRAKNLPNRRTMGKQDPYCAARLGKEAKKTETDKRGGQTPKWDQELRFTVHDSPDYHNLKVSVFNDDKKTELIGETWVSLEDVLSPGGGQSDTWHSLNCKGKYAGEIRIELTFYDTRPKLEKTPVERRRETARPGGAESQSPAVSGPRESTPVKRRPLPSDPTSASPSPAAVPEHRGIPAPQSGPRSYHTPPRQQSTPNRPNEYTPTHQRRSYYPEQQPQSAERRRLLPEASPLNPKPQSSTHNTPQNKSRVRSSQYDTYSQPNNSQPPNGDLDRYDHGKDPGQDPGQDLQMQYGAPKPYAVQSIEPLPQDLGDQSHRMLMYTQDDTRASGEAAYNPPHRPQSYTDIPHSQSAPVVPSYQTLMEMDSGHRGHYQNRSEDYSQGHAPQQVDEYRHVSDHYQDPQFHQQIEPLRTNKQQGQGQNQMLLHNNQYQESNGYAESHHSYDPYESHGRPTSAMQPTVEDEDEVPPPPPVHRSSAPTMAQYELQRPPSYQEDAPAPLNIVRYREEPARPVYESPSQTYQDRNDYAPSPLSSDRRNTHPQPSMSPVIPQSHSRPESRDAMLPSLLRHESYSIPASLVAGYNPSVPDESSPRMRTDNRMSIRADQGNSPSYQQAPTYETPHRQRHLSEPDYRTPSSYDTPLRPHPLSQLETLPKADSPSYYPHSSPQEPQQTPYQDPAPMIKPRPVSPADTRSPVDNRTSRGPARRTPTRKSVSPHPAPSNADDSEQKLSVVPFSPDSFDALNPTTRGNNYAPSTHSANSPHATHGFDHQDERRSSIVEMNDRGQVITFNGRVIDASDHLPVDSWAPEPERKGPQKERPIRERANLKGARDLEAAMQRERERKERDRIRNAVNNMGGTSANSSPSNALTLARSNDMNTLSMSADYDSPTSGRNRLQKRDKRPVSAVVAPSHSPASSHIPSPNAIVLRERENLGVYSGSPGYGGGAGTRRSIAAPPPIPAKIPLGAGDGLPAEDLTALSLELSSIDIGSGSGGRRPAARWRGY